MVLGYATARPRLRRKPLFVRGSSPRSPALAALLAGCMPLRVDFRDDSRDGEGADTAAVEAACADPGSLTTISQVVQFEAEHRTCDWGHDGNLERAQGRVSARRERSVALDLPEGAVPCDVSIAPSWWDGHWGAPYDDQFLLLFTGAVVAASNPDLVARLPAEDGLPLYRWEALAGAEIDTAAHAAWCLGDDTDCVIPGASEGGPFTVDLSETARAQLLAHVARVGDASLSLVVAGDDDDRTDCAFEALEVTVEVLVAVEADTGVAD